jgi:hypothetical protein
VGQESLERAAFGAMSEEHIRTVTASRRDHGWVK